MRTVVYEKERKRIGTGSSSASGREAAAGEPNGPRGSEDRRSFRIVGKTLASGLAERRIEGIESQDSSWPTAVSKREAEATIGEDLAERSTKGWLPNGPMDVSPRCRSNLQDIRRRIPSGACMENSSRPPLDMPEARASSTGTQRSGHRALARARMAANKKGANRNRNPLISWTKAASCCNRSADALGRRRARRRSNTPGIAMIVSRRLLWSVYLPFVNAYRSTSNFCRKNVDAASTIWLLQQLHRHCRRKVIMIWDRWSVHRSAAAYFEEHHPIGLCSSGYQPTPQTSTRSSSAGIIPSTRTWPTSSRTTSMTWKLPSTSRSEVSPRTKHSSAPISRTANSNSEIVLSICKGQ